MEKLTLPIMYSYIQTNVFSHCRQVVEDVACFSRVNHFYVGEIRLQIVPNCALPRCKNL